MNPIRTFLVLVSALLFSTGFTILPDEKSSIRIQIPNIKEGKGEILISLFNNEKGFPEESALAFRTWKMTPGKTLVLNGIPAGKYAMAILHDFDNNQKMTYNILGIPQDGYAASPDGGSRLSKPRFKNAVFQHTYKGTDLTIPIYY